MYSVQTQCCRYGKVTRQVHGLYTVRKCLISFKFQRFIVNNIEQKWLGIAKSTIITLSSVTQLFKISFFYSFKRIFLLVFLTVYITTLLRNINIYVHCTQYTVQYCIIDGKLLTLFPPSGGCWISFFVYKLHNSTSKALSFGRTYFTPFCRLNNKKYILYLYLRRRFKLQYLKKFQCFPSKK